MRLIISTLLTLATSVTANGNAIVLKNSTSAIYVWPVSSTVGPRQTVVPSAIVASYWSLLGRIVVDM